MHKRRKRLHITYNIYFHQLEICFLNDKIKIWFNANVYWLNTNIPFNNKDFIYIYIYIYIYQNFFATSHICIHHEYVTHWKNLVYKIAIIDYDYRHKFSFHVVRWGFLIKCLIQLLITQLDKCNQRNDNVLRFVANFPKQGKSVNQNPT